MLSIQSTAMKYRASVWTQWLCVRALSSVTEALVLYAQYKVSWARRTNSVFCLLWVSSVVISTHFHWSHVFYCIDEAMLQVVGEKVNKSDERIAIILFGLLIFQSLTKQAPEWSIFFRTIKLNTQKSHKWKLVFAISQVIAIKIQSVFIRTRFTVAN